MYDFVYSANPSRIVFGKGSLSRISDELQRSGLSRPLILSTPQQINQAQQLHDLLGDYADNASIFSEAAMHTPLDITEKAITFCSSQKPDCLISIGGGSTTGLGKAISIRTSLYHISVPTTYAGSEVTPVLGETADGQKKTRSDPKILPGTVIYDLDLTMTLPKQLSITSGINAIAHAVEGLYAKDNNPITNLLAQEGIKALATALPILSQDPLSESARSQAQYGSWLCGTVLGTVGMSLHHKLCHTLGGSFNLPHSETHTIVLPHALAYNTPQTPEAVKLIAKALPNAEGDAIHGLNALLDATDAPRSLRDLGMKEEDIDRAADIAVKNAYWNPRPLERDLIREVIRRAWAGEKARADL